MPYRRKPRAQRKHGKQGKVPEHILKKATPERRSLIKFGIVPESVVNPITHQPLTKKLASSSKKERDDGIAMVRSILSNENTNMNKHKMTQLWKALFYSFWMSDKVLIQQELARKLSNFIKICNSNKNSLLYIECFMECMQREWTGIDYLRMSKFLSLVRYFIHSSFDYFALNEWNLDLIKPFSNILTHKINLLNSSSRGLFLHVNDIYIEELVKVNRIDSDHHLQGSFRIPITFDALYNLLVPFIRIYLQSNKMWQRQYVIRKIFVQLMETMTFDKQQREINLNRPGKDNLDFYKYNIHQKYDIDQVDKFIDDSGQDSDKKQQLDHDNENDTLMEHVDGNNNDILNSDDMIEIDPHNPTRRKKNEKHLSFDKKNFDVVMPFKEFETEGDKKKIDAWEEKYKHTKVTRVNDPLLMKDKMQQFQNVLRYCANDTQTPNKARKKLNVLAKLFVVKNEVDKYYDREAIKYALKSADNSKQLRKFNKIKKRKKIRMRRVMKHKMKWNKMKKKGIKIKPTQKLLKRASTMIL